MLKTFLLAVSGMLATTVAYSQAEYKGSSFNEVMGVISNNTKTPLNGDEKKEWDVYQRGELPQYRVSKSRFFEEGVNLLFKSAVRTTTEKFDWYPRLTKLVHPNGICVAGKWNITEESLYTGYFAKGKSGLFVGRVSVALSETEQGYYRGFGLAGKIFPTLDPNEVVKTANFFSIDDLGGTNADHFTDTALTNEPDATARFSLIGLLLAANSALGRADKNPGFRPLYPISELDLRTGESAVTPRWFKLEADPMTSKVNEADFRNELNFEKYYPNGMKINIFVSDVTKNRKTQIGWSKLGHIQLDKSMVTYGCDRQVHFAHPKLK